MNPNIVGMYSYAYCPNYSAQLAALAELTPEKWSYGSQNNNGILVSYLDHTLDKLLKEKNVIETPQYAIFNTGLYTPAYKQIYAYFLPNLVPGRQPYMLEGFYPDFKLANQGIEKFPPRANYFSDPAALVFDTNCDILPQYDHIFAPPEGDNDRTNRVPDFLREHPRRTELFDAALATARARINANYKIAVPQYFNDRIQLLIPICLQNDNKPDLALVVSKNAKGTHYIGFTCLTLEMAYNNARLIARPDSDWLLP